ncbi:Lig_chan domain-containing protein/SBP_bac_3 domain-containing protein/ANF_receptor domain-containing protein [Cephalotus follicularis]|uniref:Glutamate receptor n=1 Tax=Cephalotus follicularis TaxID=3775 RepID=A0A1Q3CVL9_CEPFO|nr:Lig_chan domain-containing protein/SBP_bac_3 domain-containing protein/ANF_receptor domain-containing protein [Cephalotus follicularis]
MAKQKQMIHVLSFLFLVLLCGCESKEEVRVGLVLDFESVVGDLSSSYLSMAVSDFYAENANYKTRISLIPRDSNHDVVAAASAAIDLIDNEEVIAIIGPQSSSQAKFVIDLGGKVQVPIISFSATSPSLCPIESPYFLRTTLDDSAQLKAIAAIVRAYGWREIILIYEDTDYGNALTPYLTDIFQEYDTRMPYRSVIPPYSDEDGISKELEKLKAMSTKIFLVHMTASIGSKFFVLAEQAGMMTEGYAWIVTDGLSSLLDPVSSIAIDSMQGVLGIRPYIPALKKLENFTARWRKNDRLKNLNLFGLWAYDTVWAVAKAVETVGIVQSGFLKKNVSTGGVDLATLGISEMGPRLFTTILSTKFQGLSGNFTLVQGQLQASTFEVFNVIGKTERIIGYWTPEKGLSRDLNDKSIELSSSTNTLKAAIWPGDTTDQPQKLRIGVPKRTGFSQFIDARNDPQTNKTIVSGFCADVFLEVVDKLPFPLPYEFIPYEKDGHNAGTYDELLYEIYLQNYDAVVGDTTIVANRSLYVDFTLPYTESGVSMLVSMKDNEKKNIWIFLKPLSLDLWVTTSVVFIFTGLVIWVLEHRLNTDFRGPPDQQLGMIFWFSFSTLVFSQREKIVSNWSRFVLIIWFFVVLILTQSYTASLASMLTVKRLKPSFADVREIRNNGYYVGYQKDSFVKELLTKQLYIDPSKLRAYTTPEEYHVALSKGSHNGGVAAIFDEIPYINVFLAKYCSGYTMVGPTYKTAGFGFAFALKSPLVRYMSRSILNVTEDEDKMEAITLKNFGRPITCEDGGGTTDYSGSLGVYSFGGLFIITGVASVSSLLIYIFQFLYSHWPASDIGHPEGPFWSKIVELAKHFDQKDLSSHIFKADQARVHPDNNPESIEHSRHHSRTSNEGVGVGVGDGEDEIHSSSGNDDDTSADAHNITEV